VADRPVPTSPGDWHRSTRTGRVVVRVFRSVRQLGYRHQGRSFPVVDDSLWVAPVTPPEEVDRLRGLLSRIAALAADEVHRA
jgi:hypothetical protein